MHQEQRQRTQALLREKGITRALFANFHSVKWLTGFAPPIQVGPNLFAAGPAAVWYEDGHFTLIVVDGLAGSAGDFAQQPDGDVVSYPGYTIDRPLDSPARLTETLRRFLPRSGRSGRIGLEMADVTALHVHAMQEALSPGSDFVPIDGWLEPLRMIKTPEELARLRENFALTDIGHAAAREATISGAREIDVWAAVHSAINRAAGQRVPLGNDCVVGTRQANIGGWPLDHEIRAGDSLIVDLSTILHGYWSDSCATYYATGPSQRQIAIHQTVQNTLDYAISLVRPGVMARDIDRQVRQFIADAGYPVYPHHTGHAVGVSGHEAPRIVPYNEETLQAGMVILLEPGIYFPGETGVRLEDAVLVTADGAELLTHHEKGYA